MSESLSASTRTRAAQTDNPSLGFRHILPVHPLRAYETTCCLRVALAGVGMEDRPIIGNGVELGTGSVIIGNVTIGAGARIGANAVVTSDVPPGATSVGVTARPLVKHALERKHA